MSRLFQKHRYFIFVYGSLFVALLWPLLIFQKTFIFGDYWQQHYPWAYEYARLLKSGKLPYWVPGVAGGFPLVAEGQVGAYYLPHLLLYFILPFSVAYSLLILLHVLAGGIGFYLYGQRIGFSKEAATMTAMLFSFSSAYGGCFSNTAVLSVMAWLPGCLLCWEYLREASGARRFMLVSILGLSFSQMATAGAPQMALYGFFYLGLLWALQTGIKRMVDLISAVAIGAILSLPQWAATLELTRVSARAGETAGFVFWGSIQAPAIISLAYPRWGTFLGVSFYLGEAALLLSLVSLLSRKARLEKMHWWLATVFFILALGNHIPFFGDLLTSMVERFSLTSLRNPSKFLFFSTVSLAVAAGFAFDRLSYAAAAGRLKRRFKVGLCVLSALILSAPFLGQAVFASFKNTLIRFVHRGAQAAFLAKKDPFHDVAYYQAKADQLLVEAAKLFSYSDRWNILAIVLLVLSLVAILKILKGDPSGIWKKAVLPAVLWMDLLVYGLFIGNGFIGNVRRYPEKLPQALVEAIQKRQVPDGSVFVEADQKAENEVLPANANLLYHVNHAGGYSPLLPKRYYDLSKDLGISDSSLGRRPYSDEVWRREAGVVEALGVSQILTDEKLSLPGTRLSSVVDQRSSETGLSRVNKRYLYEAELVLPFAYAVYDWKVIPVENERLKYLKAPDFRPFEETVLDNEAAGFEPSSGRSITAAKILLKNDTEVQAQVNAASDAVLVFRSSFFPRWKARVDGREATVAAANHAFSGVFLKAGPHQVRFFYDMKEVRIWEGVSLGLFAFLILANLALWKKGRYNTAH